MIVDVEDESRTRFEVTVVRSDDSALEVRLDRRFRVLGTERRSGDD